MILFMGFYVLRVLCISLWVFMFRFVSFSRNGGCIEVRHSHLQGPPNDDALCTKTFFWASRAWG
jgi:hypothetical protein